MSCHLHGFTASAYLFSGSLGQGQCPRVPSSHSAPELYVLQALGPRTCSSPRHSNHQSKDRQHWREPKPNNCVFHGGNAVGLARISDASLKKKNKKKKRKKKEKNKTKQGQVP